MPTQKKTTKGASSKNARVGVSDMQPHKDAKGGSKKLVTKTAHISFGGGNLAPQTPDRPWGHGYNEP